MPDYYFETVQQIRFDVYDIDDEKKDLSHQDFIGNLETKLPEIVSSGGRISRRLANKSYAGQNVGIIHINSEEVCTLFVEITFTKM